MLPPTSYPHSIAIPRQHNMSPTPASPALKLSFAPRTSSQDSTSDGIRKRVCKACDRCRLKKSKCDGSNPCSRCKVDNAICVFGERKKSHDKVYPKGYVEMLEQQQSQLVSGLQEMYRRLQSANAWNGKRLAENNGHPLTHDILAALNLLESKHDGSGMTEIFEEDVQKLQSRLIAEGHGYAQQRRGSVSSESEHSQHGNTRPSVLARPTFRDSFNFGSSSNTSTPLLQSPVPHQRQPKLSTQLSPVQTSLPRHDPHLYAPEWAQALSDATSNQQSKFAYPQAQSEEIIDDLDLMSNDTQWQPMLNVDDSLGGFPPQYTQLHAMSDLAALDGIDVDFSKFVNPTGAMEVYI